MSTLFDQLGGDAAITAAVERFYEKVSADTRINAFFRGVDMTSQRTKLRLFLTYAFGGPQRYNGKGLRESHKHLVQQGLDDSHFDAVLEHLGATLTELGVAPSLIAQAAKIAESTRADVLDRSPVATRS